MKLRELISSAKVIKDKMKSKKIKLTGKDLLVLVRYKHMCHRPWYWRIDIPAKMARLHA